VRRSRSGSPSGCGSRPCRNGTPTRSSPCSRRCPPTTPATASRESLSELGTALERFGIGFDLLSITRSVDTRSLLTDDQYDLLAAAVERGYYDTPRRCTLTDLADAVGLATSTTTETLHRAEGTVLKRFVGDDDAGVT
jgi:hypothetical protein